MSAPKCAEAAPVETGTALLTRYVEKPGDEADALNSAVSTPKEQVSDLDLKVFALHVLCIERPLPEGRPEFWRRNVLRFHGARYFTPDELDHANTHMEDILWRLWERQADKEGWL